MRDRALSVLETTRHVHGQPVGRTGRLRCSQSPALTANCTEPIAQDSRHR